MDPSVARPLRPVPDRARLALLAIAVVGYACAVDAVALATSEEVDTVVVPAGIGAAVSAVVLACARCQRARRRADAAALTALVLDEEEAHRATTVALHDAVGAPLAALLAGLEHGTARPEAVRDTVRRAYDDLASILRGLDPGSVAELGLDAALRGLVADYERTHAPAIRIVAALAPAPATLDAAAALAIFRVAQGALGNAVRHARAATVHVTLTADDAALVLTIADDGRGFDLPAATAAGTLGLRAMRDRLRAVGGWLAIDTAPGRGTVVRAVLPVRRG